MRNGMHSALTSYVSRQDLTDQDRAHLERWLAEANDSVWDTLAELVKEHVCRRDQVLERYLSIIEGALAARREVEKLVQWRREQEDRQAVANELTQFADRIEIFRSDYERLLAKYPYFLEPSEPNGRLHPIETERRHLMDWMNEQAAEFRGGAAYLCDFPDMAGRQKSGKIRKKLPEFRRFTRIIIANNIRLFGSPRYKEAASMLNIAFPDAAADDDFIRTQWNTDR